MASRTIEAKAVISAQDKTGNVLDGIAKKFKGVAKDAKALSDIKPPKLSGDFFEKELRQLKLTQREMAGVQRDFKNLHKSMFDVGQMHPAQYMKQIDDWRGKTLRHWREVKTATEEASKAHEKYTAREKMLHRMRHGASHTIGHIAGVASGAYAVGRSVHAVGEAAGERGRALSRYDMMGLTEQETREGNDIASEISARFPSISRTEVLDYLRSNASRLGTWERSKEVAEPYARALIANKLNGGSEHEMEQVVRALEGMGKANTPGQITSGLNAFAKAKAANPDYTGEQFRTDMAAASSSKYGLSKDYMENVFPILASHTTGFGNKLSTGFSAMVGGRATKQSKAKLKEAGLIDKDGKLLDEAGFIANNFEWTQKHIKPLLEKQGVHFSEDMSEDDKGKVTSWLGKAFSARNAADLIATNLLDAPLVEKARGRHTKTLDDMDQMQKRDPKLAWEAVQKQATDAGVAFVGLETVTKGLNEFGAALARFTGFLNDPHHALPEDSPIMKGIRGRQAESAPDFLWRDELGRRLTEADQKTSPGYGLSGGDLASWRLKKFDLEQGKNALDNMSTMPPAITDDDAERWREAQREHMRGEALSRLSGSSPASSIPLPSPRPSEANAGQMPPVQPLDAAPQRVDVQGTVEGSVENKITVEIKPSKWWEGLEQKVDSLARVIGSIGSNGAGSAGKSSPDAKPSPPSP